MSIFKDSDTSAWHQVVVPGHGKTPNACMIIGERPGIQEAQQGRAFVGRSGKEQERYLANEGFNVHSAYVTNVVKTYDAYNEDPTQAEIERWTPDLQREIMRVQPRVILAVGRFAARWFLGQDAELPIVHGMPHRSDRACGAIVVPCYHPASGFYDEDNRTFIAWDYRRAVQAINGKIGEPTVDKYEGKEQYRDVGGIELAGILASVRRHNADLPIGIDTEGYPDDPWSIQVSVESGIGLVLRQSRTDFVAGIDAIGKYVNSKARPVVAIHNGMYDIEMSRAMGLDLSNSRLWDSMYAAYLTRIESQGLKALARRWCGMKMTSYEETVGDIGTEKQLAYLFDILGREWPKPEPRIENSNDGTSRLYTPQPITKRAEAIIADHYNGKREKDGQPILPKRWAKVDPMLRRMVEQELGPMPRHSLADLPLDQAVRYSARDPDATLRLYMSLNAEIHRLGLDHLMQDGMDVLPIFEEMQSSGMPASRRYFEKLSEELSEKMARLGSRISARYYGGKPFNPQSPDQVAAVMRRRDLHGAKRSKKTGKMSTGQKSIAHLRFEDEFIGDTIDWREMAKVRDSFCAPVLERIPEDVDVAPMRCQIKTTRVASRRISASDPNLTAIPTRNELGKRVRDGYQWPEGEVIGSWDLKAAEMRVMAGLSNDELLKRFFIEKRDPHAETAAKIFGIKLADVDEMKHRYPAKRAAFGIITNITGTGLYDQLRMFGCQGWSVDRCDDLIREWLKIYKGVDRFLIDCMNEVKRTGVVYDYWGMPRYLPGVFSSDKKIAAESERAASSHKIQGGAQGMIQKSMAWLRPHIRSLQDEGFNVRWTLQIHDSIMLSFDEELWDVVNELAMEALVNHHTMKLGVPMDASGSKARSWGQLK